MLTCRRCGAEYPPRPGRGKQSPMCPDCQGKHRRSMVAVRRLRHTNTTINEWVEALGPRILREKEELTERQGHLCLRCGKRRTLYFALDEREDLIGLCGACHANWTIERRSPSANRNRS